MATSPRATSSPDLFRKSKLPLPTTRYTSPSAPNTPPTTTPHRRLSYSHPPSPPLSPPVDIPIPVNRHSPSARSLRNVRWEHHVEDSETQHPSPRRDRRESTGSTRENERFSPIPYVFSPPDSPPPLSLYTSVALLHYHIHQAPQTPITPLPGITAGLGHEMPEDAILSSESQSPTSSRSRNSSTAGSPPKTTKVLPADQALEEFIAVEAALTRSPYILPRDMLPTTSGTSHGVGNTTETKEEIMLVEMDKVKIESGEEEERVKDEELARQIGETEDVLSELVEGYSRDDETDIKSLRSVPSSPFIEFTTPRIPVVESRPTTPSPSSQHLHDSISTNTTTENEPLTNNTTIEQAKPETKEQTLTVAPTLTRMPSIQRRGKEYLEQYLAKRTTKSQAAAKPKTPRGNMISPMTIFFCICITLSLLTNIILITIVLRNPTISPLPSQDITNPVGRVDDPFDIFTAPVAKSWWRWRRPGGERVVTTVPASTQVVHKGKRESWVVSKVWMRKADKALKVEVEDREGMEAVVEGGGEEGRYVCIWRRTRVFINEILGRVLGG